MSHTTWPAIRGALTTAIAAILGLDEGAVRWSSDYQPVHGTQVRIGVVSDVPDGEARQDGQFVYTSSRITLDVRVETVIGEANDEYDEDAQTLATKLRLALEHRRIRDALRDEGIALVQEPGAVRNVDYESRENTYWVCARSFELPIRATFQYEDPEFAPIGEVLRVIGSGDVDLVIDDVEFDVEKP